MLETHLLCRCLLALALLTLPLGGCVSVEAFLQYTYQGQLLDADGQPLPDVVIGVNRDDVRSNPSWAVDDLVMFTTTDQAGAFSETFIGGLDGYTGLPNPNFKPRVPSQLDSVFIYVKRDTDLLVLEVPLTAERQQEAEPGTRHLVLPNVYMATEGLSLAPGQ